jgi:two-component system, chemotaxis family, chemotaxis protein CheY
MTKTLMVVDDALIIREMVKDAALAAGWEVVAEAADGQEAVEKYLLFEPDAVTLDLVMPEFDGLHALRGIMQYNPQARVLVLSALDQKTVLQQAFKLGAADFLVKPFENASLQESLERLIEDRQDAVRK